MFSILHETHVRLPYSRGRLRQALLAVIGTAISFGSEPVMAQQDPALTRPVSTTDAAHDAHARVLAAAKAFLDTLSSEQRAIASIDYSPANAARWHTYPDATLGPGRKRLGLRLETLSQDQWAAFDDLLDAALGSAPDEGADEVRQHLSIDDYLRRDGTRTDYGRGEFKIAFLGTPSTTGLWALQFGGHHLAVLNTYSGGLPIGATPSFRGMEPLTEVRYGGRRMAPQLQEHRAFAALLASLDAAQLDRARLRRRGGLMMAGRDWDFPAQQDGLPASALNDGQRRLLLDAMRTFVGDADDATADAFMEKYRAELDRTYLGYAGSPDLAHVGDYVRIDGPSVWIEFDMDPPYSTDQPHPHALWRDKEADYGGIRGR